MNTKNKFSNNSLIYFSLALSAFLLSLILIEPGSYYFISPAIIFSFVMISLYCLNSDYTEQLIPLLLTFFFFLFCSYFFYIHPLSPSYIRVDDPIAIIDSQKYALSASMKITEGTGIGFWLGYGIEKYIETIYRVFGINDVNIAAINFLLLFASVRLIEKSQNLDKTPIFLIFLMIPLTFFYALQPSKEILSVFLVANFIYFLSITNKTNTKVVLYGLVVLILTCLVRINLALFLLGFFALTLIKFDKGFFKRSALLLLFTPPILLALVYISETFIQQSIEDWLLRFSTTGDSISRLESFDINNNSETSSIKAMLSPDNTFLNILFLPLKIVVVWLSPFPLGLNIFVIPSGDVNTLLYSINFLSSISGILNFCIIPCIYILISHFNKLSYMTRITIFFTISYLALIAFLYPSQFTRHRTLIEIPVYVTIFHYAKFLYPNYIKIIYALAMLLFTMFSIVMIIDAHAY